MLFFELIPAFMLIVALVAGIGLFVMERRASREGSGHESDSTRTP
jgi:hypothetical protein